MGLKKSGGSLELLTILAPAVWNRFSEFFLYIRINNNTQYIIFMTGRIVRGRGLLENFEERIGRNIGSFVWEG